MFNLPRTTEIKKPVPKKLIYQKYAAELNADKRDKFDDDISRIVITNEISEHSINIKASEQVSAIFVVQIDLKSKKYNDRNIVLISKLFGQRLLLVLHYENEYQLAIYETKLLKSEWMKEENIRLRLVGLDMNAVWEGMVSQVSGIIAEEGKTLDEQIRIEGEKEKIRKQLDDLERKARSELQPKKKFELFQQIKEYQKKLEDMQTWKK